MDKSTSYQRLMETMNEHLQFFRKVVDNGPGGEVFSKQGRLPVSMPLDKSKEAEAHKKLQQTCLRMCVINTIVMWESFFRDIIEEAYTLVYKQRKFDATKREEILRKGIDIFFELGGVQLQEEAGISKKVYDKLIQESVLSDTLYEAHLSTIMERRFQPVLRKFREVVADTFVFSKDDRAALTSTDLFDTWNPLQFTCWYKYKQQGGEGSRPQAVKVKVGFQAANDLIMLFYALRCCFAHGHVDIAVLREFPQDVASAKQVWNTEDTKFVEDFINLFQRVKMFESDQSNGLHIGYRTACNIIYFVKALAFKLMEYLRNYLGTHYTLRAWGFGTTTDSTETTE